MVKKLIASALVGATVLVAPLSVSATGIQEVGGSAVIEADAGITVLEVQGFNPFSRIYYGTLRMYSIPTPYGVGVAITLFGRDR